MKATVTIDLPDGWELADTKMRKAKPGEYRWLPAVGKPYRLESASEGECFIVRRIADQYVNVKLRRDDAERRAVWCVAHGDQFLHCTVDEKAECRESNACREALRERCEPCPFWRHERDRSRWCNPPHDFDWRCALPAGHAGEHGVTDDLCGMTYGQSNVEHKCVRKPHHFGSHTDDERYAKV